MEKIKTLAEAEELVKQGQDIYLVAFITKNNTQGSCLVCTTESLPLYKIYFIMNEAAYFARVGQRFRAILGTRFTPSWAAISRMRAGWPTVSWSQA